MLQSRQGVALFLVGLAHVGCSAQAEPDYLGEPLATVVGTVITTDAPPNGEIDAALLWLPNTNGESSLKLASSVVRGAFPAAFTLEVLSPPPLPDSGGGVRFGVIAAVRHGVGRNVAPGEVLGGVLDAIVVYFAHDSTTPGDDIAQEAAKFNVPATRGYHLARTVVTEEAEARFFRCDNAGLCVHAILSPDQTTGTPAELAEFQSDEDELFELCTKYLPDAPRCELTFNSFEMPPGEEACMELRNQRDERRRTPQGPDGEAILCESPWVHPPNPEQFAHPVTITLGTTLRDMLTPRYRE